MPEYFVKKNNHFLEPEEVLCWGSLAEKNDFSFNDPDLQRLELPIAKRNIRFLWLTGLVLILIFSFRVFFLQIFKGEEYTSLALKNSVRYLLIKAPRGIIYDRFEKPLVMNSTSLSLVMLPIDLPPEAEKQKSLFEQITKIFDLEKNEIVEILTERKKKNWSLIEPILLKTNIDVEQARTFKAEIEEGLGFEIIEDVTRIYPAKEKMAHLLGYTGRISPEERQKYQDYSLSEIIGKEGLELFYESTLRGKSGKRILEVDAWGNIRRELNFSSPQKGNDIFTNIDKELQEYLYEVIKERVEVLNIKAGGGIILNPRNGEVLALVSYPSFDPNIMTKGAPKSRLDDYLNSPSSPFFNRVISGGYSPGSVIKPLMALAALEEKIISADKKIKTETELVIVNPYNPEIRYLFTDWREHGLVNIKRAIAVSSNFYFYAIGGGWQEIKGLGIQLIKKYWQYFGFDKTLGIDLKGENNFLLPGPEWLKTYRKNDPDWRLGDTYHVSIGEGGLILTPLQIVSYIATIANDGILMKPQILKGVPQPLLKLNVAKDNLKIIQEGMRQTVTEGTAILLNQLPVAIAGKTGSPKAGKDSYHSFFVGYAPFEDPQIAIFIFLEKPAIGSPASVVAAEKVFRWYWENRMKYQNVHR